MKIIIELVIYCTIFTLLVKCFAGKDPLNCLYFYPKEYQDKAFELGLADRDSVIKKRKSFLISFISIMFILLIFLIAFVNKIRDFKTAYLQSLLFLEVMNCYDGLVIDELWVRYDPFWKIEEMSETPYVQTFKQMFTKRMRLAVFWIFGSLITSTVIILMGQIL